MNREELSAILQQNGIVGAGGAGFPTYAKLSGEIKTIILNCAECEPLLKLHRQLLEKYADEILKTFYQIGQVVGAAEMIIGIKKAYQKTIKALQSFLPQYPNMRLGLLEEVYPVGDEVVLIYETTGKVVKPGGLPIQSQVAVFNVETVYNAYLALAKEKPVTDKIISVVGEVHQPITARIPIGCTMEEVVALAGGSKIPNPVYFIGGPMMGSVGEKSQPVSKTTNAILVLPENHLLVQRKRSNSSIDLKRAAAACCQCSMCTDLCPRNLLGHSIRPDAFMRAATCKDIQDPQIFLDSMFCSSCGLCELYSCMQGLSPRSLLAEYKQGLQKQGVRPPKDTVPRPVGPEREYRKVPMKRLMARLDLTKYDAEAPLDEKKITVWRVKILLRQHIGSPAIPVVKPGDHVWNGQVIAAPDTGLSVAVHASIEGKIVDVNEKYVIIEQSGRTYES